MGSEQVLPPLEPGQWMAWVTELTHHPWEVGIAALKGAWDCGHSSGPQVLSWAGLDHCDPLQATSLSPNTTLD